MKQQSSSDKSEVIREQISYYQKRISQLQMEVSSLQDLISDLNGDLSMLNMKEGNPSGNEEEEE